MSLRYTFPLVIDKPVSESISIRFDAVNPVICNELLLPAIVVCCVRAPPKATTFVAISIKPLVAVKPADITAESTYCLVTREYVLKLVT